MCMNWTSTRSWISILPLKPVWRYWTNLLELNFSKVFIGNALVKISVVWWQDWICPMNSAPNSIFSLTKCLLIFTYLIQSWWTELFTILIVNWSSYNICTDSKEEILNSPNNLCSYILWHIPYIKTLNLASALLLDTTNYFLFSK